MTSDGKTTLYRLYDVDDALLYVGISSKWFARMAQHATEKGWWDDVVTVKRQAFPGRTEALAAEREAIRTERPRYNVRGRAVDKQVSTTFPPVVKVRRSMAGVSQAERCALDDEVAQLRNAGLTGIEIRLQLGITHRALAGSIRRLVAAGRATPLPVGWAGLPPQWRRRGRYRVHESA